jgi:hypothetical protein
MTIRFRLVVEHQQRALCTRPKQRKRPEHMKKIWLALLFFAGGVAHEIRNPVSCQCITARAPARSQKRRGS